MLTGTPGLEQLLKLTEAAPGLAALVQDGAYRKALEEAVRQNGSQIAAVKLDQVASPEVQDAVTRVQGVLNGVSPDGSMAGTVDPAVLELLGTEAFARICRDPNFLRIFEAPGATAGAEESAPRPEPADSQFVPPGTASVPYRFARGPSARFPALPPCR